MRIHDNVAIPKKIAKNYLKIHYNLASFEDLVNAN